MKFLKIFFPAIACVLGLYVAPVHCKMPVNEPEIIISDREPVKSSNIKSIGFDSNVLEIEFHSSKVYQYLNVPESIYDDIMEVKSKGKFFNKFIKGQYKVVRIN